MLLKSTDALRKFCSLSVNLDDHSLSYYWKLIMQWHQSLVNNKKQCICAIQEHVRNEEVLFCLSTMMIMASGIIESWLLQ